MPLLHYYRETPPPHSLLPSLLELLHSLSLTTDASLIHRIDTENCFNVQISGQKTESLTQEEFTKRLEWLLAETFEPSKLRLETSAFSSSSDGSSNSPENTTVLEFGPRMAFASAFSSNAVSICHACGLTSVTRLERSRRYRIHLSAGKSLSLEALSAVRNAWHDRMTEEEYEEPIGSFDGEGAEVEGVKEVRIMEEGRKALEGINEERGLGFDDFDLDYYTTLFKDKLQRNPTDVETFDMGQSNSEHSRHWFFSGRLILDSSPQPHTLFQLVKQTLTPANSSNSLIAFHDNSSAIRGYKVNVPRPMSTTGAAEVRIGVQVLNPILTAETHNFPCGVAPFAGAETGTGGRLRDVMATGRGAYTVAGVSAYCVGNLCIPDYSLPWETEEETKKGGGVVYPENLASPLEIQLGASDGASDYGNKFGEPVICGFNRSFGQRLGNGERVEWVKPIMFSAGVGMIDGGHVTKGAPEEGMLVVKVGGPAYRIGIGGGAASSKLDLDDDGGEDGGKSKSAQLDFDAVQRGDAEMENRLGRLMTACCDLGEENPIVSVHDQGAGGNGNVLKEIVEPVGAEYDIRKVYVGDKTMSVLEIWGAEYQENNALLIHPSSRDLFTKIAKRENCPIRILGKVTNTGRVVVHDSQDGSTPVDLPLELVLGKMPQKTFVDDHAKLDHLRPVVFPEGKEGESRTQVIRTVLERVLRLVTVGSKRFLVHKVDRSVTGLIAQQQCVGPLQLPLSNVAVTAHSHFGTTGTAVACGEQPLKGLVNSAAMARMTVAEALTNLVWARVSGLSDVKASGNWMYAAKLPGEGARMYDACEALRDSLLVLGVGIDGGKDSLSMAAKCGEEVVKAPGELVMTCYVTCPDVRKTVTPDLKCVVKGGGKGTTKMLMVDLGGGKGRMGGSAAAQVFGQIGDVSPDMEDLKVLKSAFEVTQVLIEAGSILAGHDRSDGGLVVTLLEMAFAGNCAIDVTVPETTDSSGGNGDITTLFNEEAGLVLEVDASSVDEVIRAYTEAGVPCVDIGTASPGDSIKISVGDVTCVDEPMTTLRDLWEATSFQLERRQRNPECVVQEENGLKVRKAPEWKITYAPQPTAKTIMDATNKHKVAVLRQEGSNGDKEMVSAFLAAGFEAWDVSVSDLLNGHITLDAFRGLIFVGGFSYADVLDSGKGWAGVIKFNEGVQRQFQNFYKRNDTFSLGVCNGCQLMALLGWIPGVGTDAGDLSAEEQPRLLHNQSGKFESRFSSVKIVDSPSIMLKGMEGSSLGIWVAHGEGRFHFPKETIHDQVMSKNLAPLRYVDDSNNVTQDYPFNPNGSPNGIAALCSENGRHLAMMPHPERVFTSWQWPWVPEEWKDFEVGPWLKMFQNAREFCDK